MAYELAQVNIGCLAAPLTSPQLNALAPPGGSVSEPGQTDWVCRA